MRIDSILGFLPANRALYEQALTHASINNTADNERLEFLGDAFMGLLISQWLYQQEGASNEGVLSRLKAQLCCEESMASYAEHIGLRPLLKVKQEELRGQTSILADAFEAFCGALFLDQGYNKSANWLLAHCQTCFEQRLSKQELKDPKSLLQELLQKKQQPLPEYELLKTQGPANAMTFFVRVSAAGREATAQANTKRQAQQVAAKILLETLLNTSEGSL